MCEQLDGVLTIHSAKKVLAPVVDSIEFRGCANVLSTQNGIVFVEFRGQQKDVMMAKIAIEGSLLDSHLDIDRVHIEYGGP